MAGIDGKARKVKCIGDLPALVRDHSGAWRRVLVRNVRCVPTFTDTLLSVDQFWQDSEVDCVFNSVRCIHVPAAGTSPSLDIPFVRKDHLYKLAIVPINRNAALSESPHLFFRALPSMNHLTIARSQTQRVYHTRANLTNHLTSVDSYMVIQLVPG